MVTEIVNDGENMVEIWYNIIDNGTLDEFVLFAKQYNIFQPARAKIYTHMCTKIKERLDREGLSYDTVRPE